MILSVPQPQHRPVYPSILDTLTCKRITLGPVLSGVDVWVRRHKLHKKMYAVINGTRAPGILLTTPSGSVRQFTDQSGTDINRNGYIHCNTTLGVKRHPLHTPPPRPPSIHIAGTTYILLASTPCNSPLHTYCWLAPHATLPYIHIAGLHPMQLSPTYILLACTPCNSPLHTYCWLAPHATLPYIHIAG